MENALVSDLFHMEKMSGHQAKMKKSSVEGSTAEKGLGNAAVVARSTTQSAVSFSQAMNISGSGVMTREATRCRNEQGVNANAERMENGGKKQFLDALDSSYVFPSMASRATGTVPLMFTNSSRNVKLPPEVQVWSSEAETK